MRAFALFAALVAMLPAFSFAQRSQPDTLKAVKTGALVAATRTDEDVAAIKLDFTVLPDFAQVESDQMIVNLTRFSISLPEKRQFYLEAQNFFDFPLGKARPFYSRRIGIYQGEQTPILGGARFLGKMGGTTLGIMVLQAESTERSEVLRAIDSSEGQKDGRDHRPRRQDYRKGPGRGEARARGEEVIWSGKSRKPRPRLFFSAEVI